MFKNSTSTDILNRSGKTCVACTMVTLALVCPRAMAQPRVAVIGDSGGAPDWCVLLEANGYACDNLPWTGPEGSLDSYLVVIHLGGWGDPSHLLADFLREGKGVITHEATPRDLGINTDPIVQSWIGANRFDTGLGQLSTVRTDSILGVLPVGTSLLGPNLAGWPSVEDTSGHPGAKVLARYDGGTGTIGILRNSWEGGNSVYFTGPIWPDEPIDEQIILNAVRELAAASIPTVSHWGLTLWGLLLLTAGSIVIHRRRAA